MSVYMNYPPTWRPLDFAMHYGIGVNRLNRERLNLKVKVAYGVICEYGFILRFLHIL